MKKDCRQIINLFTFLAVLSGLIVWNSITSKAADTQEMEVHFISVGQGDATLIKCGEHSMLIDTADIERGTTVQAYLREQNIEKLDYLVLTHPDADHIGGAPAIITNFDIDRVFVSNYEVDDEISEKMIQSLSYKHLETQVPEVGSQYTLGTAVITILAPCKEYDNANDSSIALIIQNGNNRFLFTGDAGEEAEKDIMDMNPDISADVYHAGHHGSKTSSSRNFVKTVSPSYAVISCGKENGFGLPNIEILNTFKVYGVKVLRTDEEGTIIARSDGNSIIFSVSAYPL